MYSCSILAILGFLPSPLWKAYLHQNVKLYHKYDQNAKLYGKSAYCQQNIPNWTVPLKLVHSVIDHLENKQSLA